MHHQKSSHMVQGAMPTTFGLTLLHWILTITLWERSHEQSRVGTVSSFTSELTEGDGHRVTQLISGRFRTLNPAVFLMANLLSSTILLLPQHSWGNLQLSLYLLFLGVAAYTKGLA